MPPPLPSTSPPGQNNPFTQEWTEEDEREIQEIANRYTEQTRLALNARDTNCRYEVLRTQDAGGNSCSQRDDDGSHTTVQLQTDSYLPSDVAPRSLGARGTDVMQTGVKTTSCNLPTDRR